MDICKITELCGGGRESCAHLQRRGNELNLEVWFDETDLVVHISMCVWVGAGESKMQSRNKLRQGKKQPMQWPGGISEWMNMAKLGEL